MYDRDVPSMRTKVPIRIASSTTTKRPSLPPSPSQGEGRGEGGFKGGRPSVHGETPGLPRHSPSIHEPDQEETLEAWRDRALRLQAEIDNFRKRQQRLAEERILADRERLLRAFLDVADNLERALATDGVDAESLRKGVDLTYRTLRQLMDREQVEPIESQGEPFDPAWHEAVGVVPHQQARVKPDTVVEVVEAGYRIGDRLLRPARVIVAT
jgi:molecular chaperone GrpE